MNLYFCLVYLCCFLHQKDASECEGDRVSYAENARNQCGECLQDECGHERLGQSGQPRDGEFHGSGIHPLDTLDVRGGQSLDGSHLTE